MQFEIRQPLKVTEAGSIQHSEAHESQPPIPDVVTERNISSSKAIIGLTPHITAPPERREPTHTERFVGEHARACHFFREEGFDPQSPRGSWDRRIAELVVWEPENPGAPTHTFLLNDALLERVKTETAVKGTKLSSDELTEIGLSQTHDAVDPRFSNDAMNAVNASYYTSDLAFSSEAGLATMFAHNRPLNRALGTMMAKESNAQETMRVKELCAGGRNAHVAYKIQGMMEAGVRSVDVTLTDFVAPVTELDASKTGSVSITSEQYSLCDDMPGLPSSERYDAIIATYGFDSVWQPEDIHLTKMGDTWYQTLYRVKVADWNPRKDALLQCMRDGAPLPAARPEDYDGIMVESLMEPFDISRHPFGKYVESLGRTATNVPGGLIKRVVNAFETQLTEHGVFVSGDVGDFGLVEGVQPVNDAVSGVAARYRGDDYVLAKKVLEAEYGLAVKLMSLEELANTYLSKGWEHEATNEERATIESTLTNGVMVVTRRRT